MFPSNDSLPSQNSFMAGMSQRVPEQNGLIMKTSYWNAPAREQEQVSFQRITPLLK